MFAYRKKLGIWGTAELENKRLYVRGSVLYHKEESGRKATRQEGSRGISPLK